MRGGAGWYLGLTQRAFQGQSAESTSAIIERANKIWRHGITMRATRLRTDEDAPGSNSTKNLIDLLSRAIHSIDSLLTNSEQTN